jgi:RNA polymerase sigma factor (sigma-70 family)
MLGAIDIFGLVLLRGSSLLSLFVLKWCSRCRGAVRMAETQLIEHLVSKHQNRIRRFITKRSGPEVLKHTTIEDLYQEAIAEALASAETFEFADDAGFVAWMGTISRRIIARSLASQRNQPAITRIKGARSSGAGVLEGQLPLHGHTPSSHVAQHERQKALSVAIEGLPEDYQKVLTLYKIKELPLDEVARRMDRSKGAVCRLVARAVAKLRQELGTIP